MRANLGEAALLQQVRARMLTISPRSARQWGKMTPHQMLCHLNDSFACVMGERTVTMRSNLLTRTVVKRIALYTPMTWPKNTRTMPEVDQQIGGTAPVEFERDREQLLRRMARFTASSRDFEWSPHPMFDRMSEFEWMRWGYLHVDHHLRQFGA